MTNESYPDDILVKSSNGTTQGEVILFQLVGASSIILRNIAVPWIFLGNRFATNNGFWLKFTLDFLFVVLPIGLCLTLFSSVIALVLTLEIVAFLSLLIFLLCEYMLIAREKPTFKRIVNEVIDDHHTPTVFITYLRSCTLIATVTAILAVDFPVFPRRFAKTETYGRSIMDVGTAAFIFCSAVISAFKDHAGFVPRNPSTPRKFRFLYSSTAFLLYLGFLRTLIIYLTGYPHEVSEYGVHWNFFYTLAFVQIIRKILGNRFHLLLGVALGAAYQILLTEYKFEDWLLSESTPRNDFISANREGLFSLLGYTSFFYLSSAVAKHISSAGIRLKSWFYRNVQLFIFSGLFYLLQQYIESLYGLPSRRIVNLPYILEMLVFFTIFLGTLLLVQLASLFGWAAHMPQFSTEENPFERLKPCLLDSINGYAMHFFLLANVFTGLVNMVVPASKISNDFQSTAIICLYLLILSGVIHVVCRRRVQHHLKA